MQTSARLWSTGLLIIACLTCLVTAEEIDEERRIRHLGKMKDLAASIRLLDDAQQGTSAEKLVEKPIIRYSDSTRETHESSLWIWSAGGRPSALLAVEYYPKVPRWLYEIASLSTKRIAVHREPNLHWTATEPGLDLRALQSEDAPSDNAVRRLIQMKELQRRFTAHERGSLEGRIELRPLSSPVFRYSDASANILGGAIFAFVNGTNPEAFLVLEAHTNMDGIVSWHYGLVRMTGERVVVELDGTEVWKRDLAEPPAARESYVNGWISAEKN